MPLRLPVDNRPVRVGWCVLLLIIVSVVALIRIRLVAIPLERDEGEYAYAGQLMLQGIPPYALAYNMKFPGTYAAYALMMSIFGQSAVGIHLGLLAVNLGTIALIFILGRRLMDSTAGTAAAASYAILSLSPSMLGLAAHAEHFMMLAVLGGALLLLHPKRSPPKKVVFASGVLFGLGLLMKQPALFFIPFGAGYLFYQDWRAQFGLKQALLRNALFVSGSALPLAATCLLFWRVGIFAKFWFWTVIYARAYGGLISPLDGIQIFFNTIEPIVRSGWPLLILATLGLIISLADRSTRRRSLFLFGLLTSSVLALCPGFYFRQHYFILILPGISLLAGAAVASATNSCGRLSRALPFLPLGLFVAASIFPLFVQKSILFAANPISACRKIYGSNPFPEAVKIAEYLREHTSDGDRIAVVGSEPEIYFYSHRRSGTGYIYTYGLMEPHRYAQQMQREMIQEIETARPKYLVLIAVDFSWLRRPNSNNLIFDWSERYTAQHFTLTGLVNIISPDRTDYYLPLSIDPKSIRLSQYFLLIYERKT